MEFPVQNLLKWVKQGLLVCAIELKNLNYKIFAFSILLLYYFPIPEIIFTVYRFTPFKAYMSHKLLHTNVIRKEIAI